MDQGCDEETCGGSCEPDDSQSTCNSGEDDWFAGTTTGDNDPCCGDDTTSDNFYNSTRACVDGVLCTDDVSYGSDASLGTSDDVCGCDSSGLKCEVVGAFDGTAAGICASTDCRANTAVISKADSTYYSGCSGSRECDSSLAGASYLRDGLCGGSSCCTDEVVTDSECDCDDDDVTSEKQCDNSVSSGVYSADGICVNDGSGVTDADANCITSGEVCVDSASSNRYTQGCGNCVDTDSCDSGLSGADYVQDGICCSSSCVGSSGSDCCGDSDCAAGEYCSSYLCTALSTPSLDSVLFQDNESLNSGLGEMVIAWSGSPPTGYEYSVEETTPSSAQRYYGTDTSYTHSSLSDNTVYCYRVRIQDVESSPGHYSDWSSTVCNVTLDRTGPSAPNLTVTADNVNNEMDLTFVEGNDSLLLYLPFEEGSGSVAQDHSIYDYDGSINGGTYTTGEHGGALSFDGGVSPNTVLVEDIPYLDSLANDFSVLVWFKSENLTAYREPIVAATGSTGSYGTVGWKLWSSSGRLNFYICDTTYGNCVDPFYDFDDTDWHYASVTWDASATTAVMYVDGLLVSSDSTPAISLVSNPYDVTIASAAAGSGHYFNGIVDEVRIYNRVLSQSEVINDMQSGLLSHGFYRSNTSDGNYTPVGGVWDDFSDGDYTSNPVWTATLGDGLVGVTDGELWSNSSGSADTYLTLIEDIGSGEPFELEVDILNDGSEHGILVGGNYIRRLSGDYQVDGVTVAGAFGQHWKVIFDGSVFRFYVDCVLIRKWSDTSSGVFILKDDRNGVAATKYYYDNFRLTPLIMDNTYSDTGAIDGTVPGTPDAPTVTEASTTSLQVSWSSVSDAGDDYYYYLKSFDESGNVNNLLENSIEAHNYSGTGYNYYLDEDIVTMGSLEVGNIFILEGEVRVDSTRNAAGGTSTVFIWTANTTDSWIKSTSFGTGNTYWTPFHETFTVTEEFEHEIRVGAYHYPDEINDGTTFFRNLRVYKVNATGSNTVTTGVDSYQVDETSSNPGSTDSGWVSSPYVDSGLDCFSQYTYKVRAKDGAANEGSYGSTASAYPINYLTCDSGSAGDGYCASGVTCYYAGTGCPNCDLTSYCTGNVRYYAGVCSDSGCGFSSEDCDTLDGVYSTEYRNYSCSSGSCTYSVIEPDSSKFACEALTHDWINNTNYPGTYSFTDETVGTTGTNIGFIDFIEGGTNVVEVINNWGGHNKVINFTENYYIGNDFSNVVTGTIEFWAWLDDDGSGNYQFMVLVDSNNAADNMQFALHVHAGNYKYQGGSLTDTGVAVSENAWQHHKVVFDCAADTFDWYVDDDLIVNDGAFFDAGDSVDNLRFERTANIVASYIDAVGYSWDSDYSVGDNTYAPCCGDDAASDDFYNGTLSNTTYFCQDGSFTHQSIDFNRTVCEQYSYNWLYNISDGLVAHWRFDESSGTLASDDSGVNDGTVYDASWVSGKYGNALSFDGSGDYIDLSNNLGYTTQVSAFAWFKSEGSPAGGYHIIFGGQELEISIPVSTGELRTGVYTTARFVSNNGSGLTDGNWHHIGFIFDGSTKKSYVDGEYVGEQTGITGSLTYNFANRKIGRHGSSTTYYANGTIDDARIYNRSLNANEVMALYKSSAYSSCCGDDSTSDYFYNDSNAFGSICYYSDYYYTALDQSQSNCEAEGLTWSTTSDYDATYSFSDDAVGATGTDIGFLDGYNNNGGTISIISDFDSHKKVIKYDKDASGDTLQGTNNIGVRTTGTIEFWWGISVNDKRGIFHLRDTSTKAIYLRFDDDGGLKYYDGTWHELLASYSVDHLYHFKLEFDLTTGDPSTNWWKCWIDGDYKGQFVDGFYGDPVSFKYFTLYGYDSSYIMYWDAIGYSWDSDYSTMRNAWARCCGEDTGEDWGGSPKCCCNAVSIPQGVVCDEDEDFITDRVCDFGYYCNSTVTPTFNLSSMMLNPGDTVGINVTSECMPNVVLIKPNFTEVRINMTSCGTNCYNATYELGATGYYHLQAFNGKHGEHNYAMFLVKNLSLVWENEWLSHDSELFKYKVNLSMSHVTNISRINELFNYSYDFPDPAYCNDVNGDGDYNDVEDELGIRVVNVLPTGDYYEVPLMILNATCGADNNLTHADIYFPINMPGNDSPFNRDGNVYALYYTPIGHNVKSYSNGIINETAPTWNVSNSVYRLDLSPTKYQVLSVFDKLGSVHNELDDVTDYGLKTIEYNDTTVTLGELRTATGLTTKLEMTPSVAVHSYNGSVKGSHPAGVNITMPDTYYFMLDENLTFNSGETIDWLKYFEMPLNKTRFTNIVINDSGTVTNYNLSFSIELSSLDWVVFLNNQTHDAIGFFKEKTWGAENNTLYEFNITSSLIKFSYYPIGFQQTAVSAGDSYGGRFYFTVFNNSDHHYKIHENTYLWKKIPVSITQEADEVAFDIMQFTYDDKVDRTGEQMNLTVLVFTTEQAVTAVHLDVNDSAGAEVYSEEFTCENAGRFLYRCNWTYSPLAWDCKDYNAKIYAVSDLGNTTESHYSFSIDDIVGAYHVPSRTLIGTNQTLTADYVLCSGNTSPLDSLNVTMTIDGVLALSTNASRAGHVSYAYENPVVHGSKTFRVLANLSDYWDDYVRTVNIYESHFSLHPESQAYAQGKAGYRSAYLEVRNPTDNPHNYTLTMIPAGITARFVDSESKILSTMIEPGGKAFYYVDVMPVTIGTYSINFQATSESLVDNATLLFTALVQTTYSTGVFNYVMASATDWISILILILLVSYVVYKKA